MTIFFMRKLYPSCRLYSMPANELFRVSESRSISVTVTLFRATSPFSVIGQTCPTRKWPGSIQFIHQKKVKHPLHLFTKRRPVSSKNRIILQPEQRRNPSAVFLTGPTRKNRHKSATFRFHPCCQQAVRPLSIVQEVFFPNRGAIPAICPYPATVASPWRHPVHGKIRHDRRKAGKV